MYMETDFSLSLIIVYLYFRVLKIWSRITQVTGTNTLSPVFGLRTKKQQTTKYSPYIFMYGRETLYPSEIPVEWQV